MLYWLESLAYGFPPLRFKGIPISHSQSIRKGIWPVFFNLYKSTQSISLAWNLMDVSVIVGPGRENRQQIPPFHLSSSITFLPIPPFFFLTSPAPMSPLTSSKESFKAVVFKGRNSSKYKLMEIQEDPLAILVLKKNLHFPHPCYGNFITYSANLQEHDVPLTN